MKTHPDVTGAHRHCTANERELAASGEAGCFCCLRTFAADSVREWIDDKEGRTALCPHCGIDSVVGDASGCPMTKAFLEEMRTRWFGGLFKKKA